MCIVSSFEANLLPVRIIFQPVSTIQTSPFSATNATASHSATSNYCSSETYPAWFKGSHGESLALGVFKRRRKKDLRICTIKKTSNAREEQKDSRALPRDS
jgi:propanediol dehydratase small subunit